MASKFRRAQRIGDPRRFPVGTGLLERWRWEQDVVHERKPRDAGGPQIEPPPSDCSMHVHMANDGVLCWGRANAV